MAGAGRKSANLFQAPKGAFAKFPLSEIAIDASVLGVAGLTGERLLALEAYAGYSASSRDRGDQVPDAVSQKLMRGFGTPKRRRLR